MTESDKFSHWAIVDVMGHQRYVGLVTEQVVAGCGFVRVDIPESQGCPAWTKLIGAGSIYAITPIAEDVARQMAASQRSRPVQEWDLPKRLTTVDQLPEYSIDESAGDADDEAW